MSSIGMRVGVVHESNVNEKIVKIFGYGIYLGEQAPNEHLSYPTPKILLDCGEYVYGHQCWWGAEHKVREELQNFVFKGFKILEVRPSQVSNIHELMYY